MKRNGNGLTAQEMIKAIEDAKGFVSTAAHKLGVSRQTFYVYLEKYKTVQQALEDVREKRHDFVEMKLFKNIEKEKEASIFFYLKTQCKHRGYGQSLEISGPDGGPVTIQSLEIIRPDVD